MATTKKTFYNLIKHIFLFISKNFLYHSPSKILFISENGGILAYDFFGSEKLYKKIVNFLKVSGYERLDYTAYRIYNTIGNRATIQIEGDYTNYFYYCD